MAEQIVVRTDYERDALELLKGQTFGHAKMFVSLFLIKTGLKHDVNRVFTAAGWENFVDITETGSHLLNMEFLTTLHVEVTTIETKIHFRLLNMFFEMTPKELSVALGFNKNVS